MISSIYIPRNSFDFLFDTVEQGVTLNFGGKSLFNFIEGEKTIKIHQISNENYIENFWNDGISNISAIVGKNGTGKTSILRSISGPDVNHKPSIYIFENYLGEIRILNQSDKAILFDKEHEVINNLNHIANLYYSPVIDFDLISTRSPITLVNYFKKTAEDYKLKSTARNIRLMNSSIANRLQKVYPDFPVYDKILLKIASLSKDFFLNPYLQSNFANPHTGDSVIHTVIDPEIRRIEEAQNDYTANEVKELLKFLKQKLKAESFSEQFRKIWELKKYRNTQSNKIHNGQNFVNNLEVTILSFLMLNSVYALRGLEGRYTDLSFMNDENSFTQKLNGFIGLYIDNVYGVWYKLLSDKFGEFDVGMIDSYIDFINADKLFKIGDFKVEDLKNDIKNRLNLIKSFFNFHSFLLFAHKENGFDGYIELDVLKHSEILETIVEIYEQLIQLTSGIPVEFTILDFSPNRILSNGEKSLIDLYASLHSFLINNSHNEHVTGQGVLLLLDEAELGYHPIWKRKFVNALNETLPILFGETKPKIYNDDTRNYDTIEEKYPIQVIFTTHDALTLSDMPQDKITYLTKLNENATVIFETSDKKTFGANIFEIFAESFFIEDLLMGDFANKKIEEVIKWINENQNHEKRNQNFDAEFLRNKKIVNLIDEPILKTKLLEMMDELRDSKELEIEFLEGEAIKIQNKIIKLRE